MTSINLIPPGVLAQREARKRLRQWAVRLGLTLTLLGPSYVALSRFATARQAEVRALTGRCALLQERLKGAEGLIQERDRLAQRRAVVEQMRDRQPTAQLLEILGQTLTPDSYLSLVSLERCEPPDPEEREGNPQEPCWSTLRLRGRAPGNRQVGEIIRQLAASPVMQEVTLVSVSDPAQEGQTAVEFELLCALADGTSQSAAGTP